MCLEKKGVTTKRLLGCCDCHAHELASISPGWDQRKARKTALVGVAYEVCCFFPDLLKLKTNKQNKIPRLLLRQEVPRLHSMSSVQSIVLDLLSLPQAPDSAARRVSLSCSHRGILCIWDSSLPGFWARRTPHQGLHSWSLTRLPQNLSLSHFL